MRIILVPWRSPAENMSEAIQMIPGRGDDIEVFYLNIYETPLRIASLIHRRIEGVASALVVPMADTKGGSMFNSFLPLSKIVGVTLFADMNSDWVLDLVNSQPETLEPLMRRQVTSLCAF
jgi:mannose/fructose-specific phosphotransferase system component IIA